MMKLLIASLGLCLCVLGLMLGLRGWGALAIERTGFQSGSGVMLASAGFILLAIAAAMQRMELLIRQVAVLSSQQKKFLAELKNIEPASETPNSIQNFGAKSEVELVQGNLANDQGLDETLLPSHAAKGEEKHSDETLMMQASSISILNEPLSSDETLQIRAQYADDLDKLIQPVKEAKPKRRPWSLKGGALKQAAIKSAQQERKEPIVPPLTLVVEGTKPQRPTLSIQEQSETMPLLPPRMASVVTGPWSSAEGKPSEPSGTKPIEAINSLQDEAKQQPLTRSIIRQYDSQGIAYQLFSDGSIEAQTDKGQFKFSGLAELRNFIERREALAS